eukprot:TRINITY_DN7594_c0_g2_i1.p1 TRINITY_DN7594_c0_g2~~TRINITY_DN7594_c0_g2_i1.p1  ORF type:complete len:1431 (-),score=274.40 TRINITY_DN7594_c0_g2_i1:55-4347(-)
MNNYHLNEEIGHGKFSIVYKGRKRHTIRYVAVKSIEKNRRDKVMVEVSVLSQLQHTNVVGFVNWHETRNHLWIIFEYCAGGDMLRLIKQDGRLPEDQVRRFGRDVSAGLLHVHSRSVIYSDLKPANLLFNEEGTLKLSDFGYSQRLDEVARAIRDRTPLPRRGTPHYMAPELFQEGGMHSFASDLWAFGCVLHELSVGRPPFHSSSFSQLQQLILTDPVSPASGSSSELQALVSALLQKGPLSRADWSDVRTHGFWQNRAVGDEIDARNLPTQPHLDEVSRVWQRFVGGSATPSPAPSSGGGASASPPAEVAPAIPSRQGSDLHSLRRQAAAKAAGAMSGGLPPGNAAETPLPKTAATAPASVPPPPLPSPTGAEASTPSAASPPASACSEPEAELDPPRDDCSIATMASAGGYPNSAAAGRPSSMPALASPTEKLTASMSSGLRGRLGAPAFARVREIFATAETGVRPISRNPQIEELESLVIPQDLPFTPLSLEEVCARPHNDLETFLARVYRSIAQGSQEQKMGALRYLEQICCHMQVADIVVNSTLLRLVLRMLHARRSGNSGGISSTNGSASGGVGSGGGVATAGGSAPAVAASPALRARLLSLIGQLLRHTTYLEPAIADLGLFEVLLEGLCDQDSTTVRRRSAAALGELLFYVATQPPPEAARGANGGSCSGSGDTSSAAVSANAAATGDVAVAVGWHVPAHVLQVLAAVFASPDEDEVVQHYVVKTVENVATQCPAVAQQWFFLPELLRAFVMHARRSTCDPFRLSCLAAAAHLLRGRPECEPSEIALIERDLPALGFADLAPQGVTYSLLLLASLLICVPSMQAAAPAVPEHSVDLIMGVVAQPRYSAQIRGRACVLLGMFFALDDPRDSRHLRAAIDRSFVPHIDRLGREKEPFVVQCVAAATAGMDVVAVAVLQSLVEGMRQLDTIRDAAAAKELAGGLAQVLPVFLHLLSSVTLCGCVFGPRSLPLLGAICELTTRALPGSSPHGGGNGGSSGSSGSTARHQLQPLVLMIMETLGTQQALLMEHAPQVVRCVLPALAACLPSARADVRLLALKSFSAICIMLLNDGHVFDSTAEKPTETAVLLEALLCGRALPVLPTLLSDEAPAPSCALRLLAVLLSRGSPGVASVVRDLGLAPPILAALSGQQALSLHTALLVHCLLRERAVRVQDLLEAGVLDAVHSTFGEAVMGNQEQMDFAMVDASLCVAEEVFVQTALALQQQLQHQVMPYSQMQHHVMQQQQQQQLVLLSELGPLSHALPLLAALCAPLAHAKLGPLLERAVACCQNLADIAQLAKHFTTELSPRAAASLLEALAALARWRHTAGYNGMQLATTGGTSTGNGTGLVSPEALPLQRRLLAVLAWAVAATGVVSTEVRADIVNATERLLRDRLLGDDPAAIADARGLIAAAVGGRGAVPGVVN